MTSGQQLAIDQLQEINSTAPNVLRIVQVLDSQDSDWVYVLISLKCGYLTRVSGGLKIRNRERFIISIHQDFPFKIPIVRTPHKRFANFPHVQWSNTICLYQAPSTEWNPSDGLFGLLERLNEWLIAASLNELDPVGAPLHPPVAYVKDDDVPQIIPTVNTPQFKDSHWFGFVEIEKKKNHILLKDWIELSLWQKTSDNIAAAILLDDNFPFEFPEKVQDFIDTIIKAGVDLSSFILLLDGIAMKSNKSDPLYFVIGTPMRGISGSDTPIQHLTTWMIDGVAADALRLSAEKYSKFEELKTIGEKAEQIFLDWSKDASLKWCYTREARPEVLKSRDENSIMHILKSFNISVWGCGALGSHVAEMLIRLGVKNLKLHDNSRVAPGILCRQLFNDEDIGDFKVNSLKKRLLSIAPNSTIEISTDNIIDDPLGEQTLLNDVDLIIDTTANSTISEKLEFKLRKSSGPHPIIASLSIGHDAQWGMSVVCNSEYSGGIKDAERKSKIDVCNGPHLKQIADEFWPLDNRSANLLQPEPGCSDLTFVGSSADIFSLSGSLLNQIAGDVAMLSSDEASVHIFKQPMSDKINSSSFLRYDNYFKSDTVLKDPHTDYEVRLSHGAHMDMKAWVSKNNRDRGVLIETGGLLFGEWNHIAKICWVSEVSGPPPDSIHSENGFVTGTIDTTEQNREKNIRSRGSIQYLGNWHTHPNSQAIPSEIDIEGVFDILLEGDQKPSKVLLLIAGLLNDLPQVGVSVFGRQELLKLIGNSHYIRAVSVTLLENDVGQKDVGLTLSGGGLRAVAFHLGCLRALNDRGLLKRIKVISAVSGGSIIAAMYAYSNDNFDSFNRRVEKLLERGLVSDILKQFIKPKYLIKSIFSWLYSVSPVLVYDFIFKPLLKIMHIKNDNFYNALTKRLRRFTSISNAFQAALENRLFKGIKLTDHRRDGLDVVFNATELRTGTAFRFGSRESGCWRYGELSYNQIPISLAVTASAAYPLAFPSLDCNLDFLDKKGMTNSHRVKLTDGGIYDNLGVTCLEPGKSSSYSYNVFQVPNIISCDAGQGMFSGEDYPIGWIPRVSKSFESVFRKAHDSTIQRLFNERISGNLDGFILSYLGQQDNQLPYIPSDLIKLDEVKNYPTNLSAMSKEDIQKISKRGEQLTQMLISRYISNL